MNEIANRLYQVGNSDDEGDTGFGFRMLNTSSSYEGQDILAEFLKKAEHCLKTPSNLKDAFHWAFAITFVSMDEDFWYTDTDVPDVVEKLVARLFSVWRKALKGSDAALEISPSDRDAVRVLIKRFKDQLEAMGYTVGRMP